MSECNDAASLADLETAIYLFGEALDRCPLQHPLRSESLRGLAGALVTRFSVTNQLEDLDQVILLRDEIFQELRNTVTRTGGQSQLDVRGGSISILKSELNHHHRGFPLNTTACFLLGGIILKHLS